MTFNKSRHHFTQNQYDYIKDELKEMIYFFGYADVGDNPIGYYSYDEHDRDMLEIYAGF